MNYEIPPAYYDGPWEPTCLASTTCLSNKNMALSSIYLRLLILLLVIGCINADSRLKPEVYKCRILESKFVDSQPWTEYPIVFEPISRGRLTIWSGVTTLPASEFLCHTNSNQASSSILLEFANYADKLEWTFYDMKSGTTYNGISVNHRENAKFNVTINSEQFNSYKSCNLVENVQLIGSDNIDLDLKTMCSNCERSIVAIINTQLRELIKSILNEQIEDSLRWHLMEMVSNQHYSGPIPFTE